MYEKYWGLREKPFENTPDPRFFYKSLKHEEALARLVYTIEGRKALGILTGDYGSGKTLICRTLFQVLNPDVYKTAVIVNPRIPLVEFLIEISRQLGAEAIPERKIEILNLIEVLLKRNLEIGKNTVVIVDESHLIDDPETFEELRLLLNFQLNEKCLLTLIFIGQTELREKISRNPQLKQRVSMSYHLSSLDEKETKEYIEFRLKVAGKEKEIFASESIKSIYTHSKGLPRVINNICDLSLFVGCGKNAKKINGEVIEEVIAEL